MINQKTLLTAAGALLLTSSAALADTTGPALCHPECEIQTIKQRIWIPPQFRVVTKREWIPARFELRQVRHFVPAQYRSVRYREWIPARYERQACRRYIAPRYECGRVAIRNHCGQIVGYRTVRRQVPGTGRWVVSYKRVQVAGTGIHVWRTRRDLVPGTGVWTTRTVREQVPGTGIWVSRQRREQVPGTGLWRVIVKKKLVCHHVDQGPIADPRPPVADPQPPVADPQPPVADPRPLQPIRVTGNGAPRADASGPQARLLALRAARLDAMRKLAETVNGIQLDSRTTVRDFVTENDEIASRVAGVIRGARELDVETMEDGTVAVTLELDAAALQALLDSLR